MFQHTVGSYGGDNATVVEVIAVMASAVVCPSVIGMQYSVEFGGVNDIKQSEIRIFEFLPSIMVNHLHSVKYPSTLLLKSGGVFEIGGSKAQYCINTTPLPRAPSLLVEVFVFFVLKVLF